MLGDGHLVVDTHLCLVPDSDRLEDDDSLERPSSFHPLLSTQTTNANPDKSLGEPGTEMASFSAQLPLSYAHSQAPHLNTYDCARLIQQGEAGLRMTALALSLSHPSMPGSFRRLLYKRRVVQTNGWYTATLILPRLQGVLPSLSNQPG